MNAIIKRTFVVALGGAILAGLSFVDSAGATIRGAAVNNRSELGAGANTSHPNSIVSVSYRRRARGASSRHSSYRRNGGAPKKAPWQYSKLDPRRHGS